MPQSTDQPLDALAAAGVSIWLDDLSRGRLDHGSLRTMIDDQRVVGVTTNPTIFQRALGHGADYSDQLRRLAGHADAEEAVRQLTTSDVRRACDELADIHAATDGVDGMVSIEVDPRLAHDTEKTVADARSLWSRVDRPNVLIKIPATPAGLPAITTCIADGINVNVTLVFSLDRYEAVADAYMSGLEIAHQQGRDLARITSVASFFVSRVDTAVDAWLTARQDLTLEPLLGTAAIANARLAYGRFQQLTATPRWTRLAAAGARVQRPLWASTGVKDPRYDDTRYVVELVGPGTVNTMPEATLRAVADHGVVLPGTILTHDEHPQATLDALTAVGLDLTAITRQLEADGVDAFVRSWEELLATVQNALDAARAVV